MAQSTSRYADPIDVTWESLDGPGYSLIDLVPGSVWQVSDRRVGEDSREPAQASIIRLLDGSAAILSLELSWHIKYWSPRGEIEEYVESLRSLAKAWTAAQFDGQQLIPSPENANEDLVVFEVTLRGPACDLKTLFNRGEAAHHALMSGAHDVPVNVDPGFEHRLDDPPMIPFGGQIRDQLQQGAAPIVADGLTHAAESTGVGGWALVADAQGRCLSRQHLEGASSAYGYGSFEVILESHPWEISSSDDSASFASIRSWESSIQLREEAVDDVRHLGTWLTPEGVRVYHLVGVSAGRYDDDDPIDAAKAIAEARRFTELLHDSLDFSF